MGFYGSLRRTPEKVIGILEHVEEVLGVRGS